MREDQIAVQLYTVRSLASVDLDGTLDAVAAAGYRAVEIAGLPDVGGADLARSLGAVGLRPVAAHVGIERLREAPDAVADWLVRIDCPRVIVPWMPETDRGTVDDVRRFADGLQSLADRFAPAGIRVGYHNHAFEFDPLEGTTIWDVFLEQSGPDIDIEVDVYWMAVAGRDPVAGIERLGRRVRMLHMKDLSLEPVTHDVPAGTGTLPFPGIISVGRSADVEWYVVEQDEPVEPIADIAAAYRYLQSRATRA